MKMATQDDFDDLWAKAVDKYIESTGRTVLEQTLLMRLKSLEELQKRLEQDRDKFTGFRAKYAKFTERAKMVIRPFTALSTVTSSALALSSFAPAPTIFGAVLFVVQAADGVSEAYDWIDQLFDKLGDFTVRLDEYVSVGMGRNLGIKVVHILGCLLEILARSEKTIKIGRWRKYAAVLFLGQDEEIKASFDKLSKLLEDEQRLISAITFATNRKMDKRIEEIKSTVSQTLTVVKDTQTRFDTTQHNQLRDVILKWICTTDFPSQQSDVINQRETGTGQWFLDASAFNTWVHGSKQTLYCPGMPGSGKTVLAATAIEYLAGTVQNDTRGVVYVYCNYQNRARNSTTMFLAAILRQLLQGQQSIPEFVLRLYERHSRRGTTMSSDEVLTTLRSVLKNYSSVHLVIDALDEFADCKYDTRRRLLAIVSSLQKEGNMNIMITSRFIPEIEEEFEHTGRLRIRATDNDVKRFITNQIHRLPKCVIRDKELQSLVQNEIVKAADGMFLLARLYIELLQDTTTKKQVKSILEVISKRAHGGKELSQVYDQLYDEAIKRIKSQPRMKYQLARNVLSWITYAERLLTTEELSHALAVELDEEHLDGDNVPDVEDMISVCAGLVVVDEASNFIRLVHYTTQEYFEQIREKWNPSAQEEITLVCLTYLSFDTFKSGMCGSDKEFESRLDQNKLLDYASRHWGQHARTVQEQVSEIALPFLQDNGLIDCATQAMAVSNYKYQGYSQKGPRQSTGLHLTAGLGLLYFSQMLVLQLAGNAAIIINAKDSYGQTPLSWAAKNGHSAVVQLLIESGADIKSKDASGWTPLTLAVKHGCEAVVQLLVQSGADIESKDVHGRTPLSWAAWDGHVSVAQFLAEKGADLESKDDTYDRSPLSWGALNGHWAVVLLLFKEGADIESKDFNGQTPLILAAASGRVKVVQLLVEVGADIESKDMNIRTPLSWAAWCGYEVVQLLLSKGADVKAQDKEGRTPLSRVAENGHEPVVKLLVDKGADIQSKDNILHRTPLAWAALNGNEEAVKLLIEAGADLESKDSDGRTPLTLATANAHREAVRLLVNNGADVRSKGMDGQTPLSWAVRSGDEAVLRMLRDEDVGVHDT
ncbi:hypothetical protein ETB97_005977 [Aspergillus alliaceus]|uniref:Uncharacterized protein n=1 Tax=Petromyces alliaceus TaxID=209559 RepID=A0A8H6A0Q7_PETAA|nr:hypothetical protein ETB97_005977 [Aspergillus burnettii]